MNIFNEYWKSDYPLETQILPISDGSNGAEDSHEKLELILVETGSLLLLVDQQEVCLNTGQGIFINQNVPHKIKDFLNHDTRAVSLRFLPSLIFNADDGLLQEKYLHPVISSPQLRYLVLDKTDRETADPLLWTKQLILINKSPIPGYELEIKAMLCHFWKYFVQRVMLDEKYDAAQPTYADRVRIKFALKYIEEHFANPLTLGDIASSIHTSNSECCRCFKRTLEITPFEYLLKYRIFEAARLLADENAAMITISDLAASVGFNNSSYFNKKFREYLHCTPKEYRKNYRQA